MNFEDRIAQLRAATPQSQGIWEIRYRGERYASRLGTFEDAVRMTLTVVGEVVDDLETLEIRLVEPAQSAISARSAPSAWRVPKPAERKVVRIEIEYEDGETQRAVGDDANAIWTTVESYMAVAQLREHNRYTGPFLQTVREAHAEKAHAGGGESVEASPPPPARPVPEG